MKIKPDLSAFSPYVQETVRPILQFRGPYGTMSWKVGTIEVFTTVVYIYVSCFITEHICIHNNTCSLYSDPFVW